MLQPKSPLNGVARSSLDPRQPLHPEPFLDRPRLHNSDPLPLGRERGGGKEGENRGRRRINVIMTNYRESMKVKA